MGLVLEEQVEPKAFQVEEKEKAEGLLEGEANHVDPEPGKQLEDVQVDLDTVKKKY